MTVSLVFPHQLFYDNPSIEKNRKVFLVEEFLFFNQYNFHKHKLVYHRATMQMYRAFLEKKGIEVTYIESHEALADVRELMKHFGKRGVKEIHFVDVTDNWLQKRIENGARKADIGLVRYETPMFMNTSEDLERYFMNKRRFFQADFYATQRKTRRILVDKNEEPAGGKWSFDTENRLKFPKKRAPPTIKFPGKNEFYENAKDYVREHFADNYGDIPDQIQFPATYQESKNWLKQFLENRFEDFGKYEDAIISRQHFLHHGVLTPMLNTGLLTPAYVIEQALHYAEAKNIPLNSLEGFVRQIIGWREFIHGVYEYKGSKERTRNYWGFSRRVPEAFWRGDTGILPVDTVVKKILASGYCHHIERLMVIGNFMLLCEFHPDDVYQWFMELFIDSYDWVMVPNVYGMSQFADGGLMATKPYISASNYLLKMSDFEKGDWQHTWDGLFWRFIDKHRKFFSKNPRMNMMVRSFDDMDDQKRENHLKHAEAFLRKLDLAAE